MKPLPSRLKIALLSAAISGVVLLAFGGMTGLLIHHLRLEALDREIRVLGSRHPGLIAGRGGYERLASSLEFTFGEHYTNHILLRVDDAAGRTIYVSSPWPKDLPLETLQGRPSRTGPGTAPGATDPRGAPGSPPPDEAGVDRGARGRGFGVGRGGPPPPVAFTQPPRFATARTAQAKWRLGLLGSDEFTLVIGLNQQDVDQELSRLARVYLLTLPVALFLVGLGGWVVAGRALRPLTLIADTAERVTAHGLDQRIPESGDSPEASRLILVLNRMMDRLETSFRQATRFSADASHELKTPLTVMQGELENALQSAAPGSPEQQLFSTLLEETQRLKSITRSLLLLAQADAGQLRLAVAPLDLTAELEGMIEDARVLAAGLRLHFEVQAPPQLRVEADGALLRAALFNLIGNAVRYNAPNGTVTLALTGTGDQVLLTVCNTGPGIPQEDQPRVFERFYRVSRADTPSVDGIGLGLSLAREIIRAHGGELTLRESRPGRTCFEVRLRQRAGMNNL